MPQIALNNFFMHLQKSHNTERMSLNIFQSEHHLPIVKFENQVLLEFQSQEQIFDDWQEALAQEQVPQLVERPVGFFALDLRSEDRQETRYGE
jgi:hypothetical protein